MNKKDFYNISIRGRIAYAIMCFEAYAKVRYPTRDFTPVCTLMWDIVSDKDSIDISTEKYMEIIPEYLYEFPDYKDADFEYLSKDEFDSMHKIIPSDCGSINSIMHRIYDIAMEHAYIAFEAPAKSSIDLLFDVIAILRQEKIPLPDISKIQKYAFNESGGWGVSVKTTA